MVKIDRPEAAILRLITFYADSRYGVLPVYARGPSSPPRGMYVQIRRAAE